MRQDILDEVIDGEPRYNILDNADGTKNIELANYVIEGGTPINKELFMRVFGMNNYELLSNVQEDISENTTSKVYGQFASTPSSGTTWTGYCIGNANPEETWGFTISSNRTLSFDNDGSSSSHSGVVFYLNGDSVTGIANINKILTNTTGYTSSTYMRIYAYSGAIIYFTWDCYKPRSANFSGLSGTHEGSADGVTWVTADSSTPYRYHRLVVNFTSNTYKNFTSVYINASDTKPKYRNNFTSVNNFSIQECANVIVPNFENDGHITENNINGIPVDLILGQNTDYKLRYDGEKLVKDGVKVVGGVFASPVDNIFGEETLNIVIGFKADLIIIYSEANNSNSSAINANDTKNTIVPRILTNEYIDNMGAITETGFNIVGANSSSFPCFYIAIRF